VDRLDEVIDGFRSLLANGHTALQGSSIESPSYDGGTSAKLRDGSLNRREPETKTSSAAAEIAAAMAMMHRKEALVSLTIAIL
jgi:hypothetical protein